MSGAIPGDGWRQRWLVDETEALVKDKRDDGRGPRDGQRDGQSPDTRPKEDGTNKAMPPEKFVSEKRSPQTTPPQTWEERRRLLNQELNLNALTPRYAYIGAVEFSKQRESTSDSDPPSHSPSLSTSTGTAAQGLDTGKRGHVIERPRKNRGHKRRTAVVVGEEERLRALAG